MSGRYLEIFSTPAVLAAQDKYFGQHHFLPPQPERNELGEEEIEFIGRRDSFYLGSVSESGWPYIQHRGGPVGFLRVLSRSQLGFADYKGNRQLISTGNLTTNDRVSLFLMDYSQRARLKIMGHARVQEAREHPTLVKKLVQEGNLGNLERFFLLDVVSFDWNCSKYITPRYTLPEIEEAVSPLKARIMELENRLKEVNLPKL